MQITEAIHELLEVVASVLLLEFASLCDIVEERATVDELEEDVLEGLH